MDGIRVINDIRELEQYECTWTRILKENNNNIPFIEFDWIRNWWTFIGENHELYVLLVSINQQITGFCPLMLKKHGLYQEINFIGYPQASYMDFIVCNEYKVETIKLIADYLMNLCCNSIIDLHGMFEDSANFNIFKKYIFEKRRCFFVKSLGVCFIRLEGRNFEDYLKNKFSSHVRKELSRRERKLGEIDDLVYGRLSENRFEEIFEIHKKRWKKKNDGSHFAKENIRKFFMQLAFDKSLSFKVTIDALCLKDRLIAFKYGFECNGRYSSYRIAHDDDFCLYGPGKLITKKKIKECFENGIQIYDFGTGADLYKLEWAEGLVSVNRLIFYSGGVISQLVFYKISFIERIKNLLKKNPRIIKFIKVVLGKIKYYLSQEYLLSFYKKAIHEIKLFGGYCLANYHKKKNDN